MYRKILVPASLGQASEWGVREAIRLARTSGASLRFIHVAGRTAAGRDRAGFSGTIDDYLELLKTLDRECAEIVEGLHRLAEPAGVTFEIVIRSTADGTPCEQVVSEALDWRADVIVMGGHSRLGAGPRPSGLDDSVLRSSPVPVMVFSPPARHQRPDWAARRPPRLAIVARG
jgi:nucleotide-binding universal stress UspA family protein